MKQDIPEQKQIYADYYTINKSANKGYHKRCTIEFHSSYDIKQKTSPRREKTSISQTDASISFKWKDQSYIIYQNISSSQR